MQPASKRLYPVALAAIILAGLALRIMAARGGLWLDEAWSARLARDAGTPLGIFLKINHDNNHHLNSLWLQMVGFGAPPMMARALSIATGTIAIAVAGLIGTRRGRISGLVTALLFAISPMMVTLGSEARGYAPMSLAFLVAILLVDRKLAGEPSDRAPFRLALCALLGAFSQLTIVFGWVALVGWTLFVSWRRRGLRQAIGDTLTLFWPSLVALAVVAVIVFGAGHLAGTGFQFGRYDPFDWSRFSSALTEMTAFTLGSPWPASWLAVLVAIIACSSGPAGSPRAAFYSLAILGFPLALTVLHVGNTGYPRYYLVAAVAILIMAGEAIGGALKTGGAARGVACTALMAITAGSFAGNIDLLRNQRGDPGRAVAAMRAAASTGATVLLDRETGLATIEYAAAADPYPLTVVGRGCRAAAFLFADRFKGETFPATIDRCGGHYRPIASAHARGLSGTDWTLYERQP